MPLMNDSYPTNILFLTKYTSKISTVLQPNSFPIFAVSAIYHVIKQFR